MGGVGSGTWVRENTKRTVDSYDRLYVWELDRLGFIPSEGSFAGNWGWADSGRGIAFSATSSELHLVFHAYTDEGERYVVEQSVPIERWMKSGVLPRSCPVCRNEVVRGLAPDWGESNHVHS